MLTAILQGDLWLLITQMHNPVSCENILIAFTGALNLCKDLEIMLFHLIGFWKETILVNNVGKVESIRVCFNHSREQMSMTEWISVKTDHTYTVKRSPHPRWGNWWFTSLIIKFLDLPIDLDQSRKCRKLQFFDWPLGTGSEISISIDVHVKISTFTAGINIFMAWFKSYF